MKFFLFSIVSLALVASVLTDAMSDLESVNTALKGKLDQFAIDKQTLEQDVAGKKTVVEAAQATHDEKQATFLVLQKAYWDAYDIRQKALSNVTAKSDVRDQKQQALDDAVAQKTNCNETMVGGECPVCLDTAYSCSGEVSGTSYTRICDCDGYRSLLRHKYGDELSHTEAVLLQLKDETANPIDEYEQRAQAEAGLLQLKAELEAKLLDIDLQEDVHEAYIADLTAELAVALDEYNQAVAWEIVKQTEETNANAAMVNAQSELDAAGTALNSEMQQLKLMQKDYKEAQTGYTDALTSYRDELKELTSILDTHQISAKTGLYFDKCGSVEIPTVNLRKSFTIEFWAYFDSSSNNRGMLPAIAQARVPGSDDTKYVFQIKLRGGPREKEASGATNFDYYFWDARMGSPDSPGYAVRMWGNHFVPTGWSHVAFVVDSTEDPSSTKGTLYVNGEEEYVKYFFGSRWSSMEPITLMKYVDEKGTHCSHGMIDELRFWSVARTQTEIKANMRGLVDGRTEPLRSYYRFDENSAQPDYREGVVLDQTPNRLDGTIIKPSGHDDAVKYLASSAFEIEAGTFREGTYALYLDSTTSSPNYVALPAQDFTGAFTLEAYINFRASKDDKNRLPKIALPVSDGTRREEFVFTLELVEESLNAFKYVFKMGNCKSADDVDCSYALELSSPVVNVNGWRHVAVTVSRNGVARLLIDGLCDDGTACHHELTEEESASRLTSTHSIDIGRIVDDNGFHGSQAVFDEVRIWKVGRTVDQILAFKSRTLPKSTLSAARADRDITAYYRFDEAAGLEQVYDSVIRNSGDYQDVEQMGRLVGPRVRLTDQAFKAV
uniref:LamG-like jellyroll fold domain-containing protein n=1 Tax=Palpitomonas bilix TaxID=652834 RepID=A0A7S3DK73_9EUKA|mmetsp:Transcript_40587/g.105348  ORF Transcript_40587/g.105348 Transcript_40587/m.105348 type:complete len:836 (+) Transcript_40587:91-2598(+)